MTFSSLSTGANTILWNAVAGKSYRVQFKNNLNDASWADISTLVASGSTAAFTDQAPVGQPRRFYRVVLQP